MTKTAFCVLFNTKKLDLHKILQLELAFYNKMQCLVLCKLCGRQPSTDSTADAEN